MHVIFRESHGLEEADTPQDLGQDAADLVVLSFSDSDLGAFAAGWQRAAGSLPSLRLANLASLRHPLSVDTYVERTLRGAKGVLVRVIGGEQYWSYGLASLHALAREKKIALACLPAGGNDDSRLDALSTLPVSTLRRLTALCDAGGPVAAQAALAQMALASGLYAQPVAGAKTMPDWGWYDPDAGVMAQAQQSTAPFVPVVFYRSYLTAADLAPIDALIAALRQRGFACAGLFAPSLKFAQSGEVAAVLKNAGCAAIVNATAFSARLENGASPLDSAGCPVFQVALSTAGRQEWARSERGLSPADLAMHVVLPEVDGRVFTGVVSFKAQTARDDDLQYSRQIHQPDPQQIADVATRVAAWHQLQSTPPADKRLALILSTYPGKAHQIAHAVGLDALASANAILGDLSNAGYATEPYEELAAALSAKKIHWPLKQYLAALATLPESLQQDLQQAWGAPENDRDCADGGLYFHACQQGNALVALQPERGEVACRDATYHDLSRTPRHAYVAFYLWLRARQTHACVHIGAHGTLEWLPGKAVALSPDCWPQALTGPMPVIYPFIVNDPGEAAQARRRIGAVTLGHLPPPMTHSAVPDGLQQLETLLDEYSTADGLDPARRDRLVADIRAQAAEQGVEADLGLAPDSSAAEAIVRIDRFVCDIKESQFGDGLHVYGRGDCGEAEREGLIQALDGKRVAAGPSGSPYRGRSDVLPTGRNLYTTDPRAVPSRAAHAQGVKLAEELLRRHLQDHGDWPHGLVVDLWGSATMRTAGEEFAMALHLAGAAPRWDTASSRVSGFEILPLALLGRPRIAVTLRVSGLFRDVFPGLGQLFESVAAALAARDEGPDENPYSTAMPRVFGPRPGQYGLGMGAHLDDFSPQARLAAGEAWINNSQWAVGQTDAQPDRAALEAQMRSADSFVHVQDLAESDLLLAADYAAHEAGFAAAMQTLGKHAPALYHLDSRDPEKPRARTLTEEIARTVRARAANPEWASGMMRHGFRGAAEIAATLEHLAAFAHLAGVVPEHLFDIYHDATLGRAELYAFMEQENPVALNAMKDCFTRLIAAGLWNSRRNSVLAGLSQMRDCL
ncbi:cobaltochelatase subunit CobN [Aureimonas fodinaquatilis]|uniref:Cobaltochelatase subunit CobN n=1 Tax=Aureimonas fodinaquatilis TaxID=2565783 RepID=A0A5B0DWH5_9HYPH|nr:cobaltochelatase subunit CobN [Aureimonas fodinaquatilis]KAA0969549.1 cobaltochelatase subunit CobN [Aureimonas fodinaquatilis]